MREADITNLVINYRRWLEDGIHLRIEIEKLRREKAFYLIKKDYYRRNPSAIKTETEVFFFLDSK